MKKILTLICMAMIFVSLQLNPAFAGINKEFTFTYQQDVADLPQLKEWRLYIGDATGGPFTPALDTQGLPIIIPYDPADIDGDYTTTQVMVIPGVSGTSVNKFFVMTAVDKENVESAYSNEAIDESTGDGWVVIKIPMGRPFSFKVQVKPGNVP